MADNKKDSKEKGKTKRPSAQKRILQSDKAEARNKAYKAKVSTLTRSLKEAVAKKDAAAAKSRLTDVYSLMDKGVKTGVFKQNKAARVKSRFSKLASV